MPVTETARKESGKAHLWAPEPHFLDGRYVSPEHVAEHGTDPSEAQTINRQGFTLVPLDVRIVQDGVYIRAKDPD